MLSMRSLYRNNWYCYCVTHICCITFCGSCGFHFIVPQLYNGKCYNPIFFMLHLMSFVFIIQSYVVDIISKELRLILSVCFGVYYLLLFLHMQCFLKESFEPDPVWKEVLQRKRRREKESPLMV